MSAWRSLLAQSAGTRTHVAAYALPPLARDRSPGSALAQVPHVTRQDYSLLDISDDGFVRTP